MIIVQLIGGLGNQMFQYAVGRKQSLRLNTELKLDHSFLETDSKGVYTQRRYELDVFNTIQTRATKAELEEVKRAKERSLIDLFRKKTFAVIHEKGPAYDRSIEELKNNSFLTGFWQSEKYFKDIREILLKDFSLATPLRREVQQIKDRIISKRNAVSIHFRRGDYVHLSSAAKFHGITSVEYYKKAVTKTDATVPDASYFIFSDEIEWVKENFQIPGAEYVAGLKGYEDLELMKTCQHHIIANSSFSWWGAWLNAKPNKVVIAPQQWFTHSSIDTKDLIPTEWQRL